MVGEEERGEPGGPDPAVVIVRLLSLVPLVRLPERRGGGPTGQDDLHPIDRDMAYGHDVDEQPALFAVRKADRGEAGRDDQAVGDQADQGVAATAGLQPGDAAGLED